MDVCPHLAAAEPPSYISANRNPPNASSITITWTQPTTGATPTGYKIYFWADGHSDTVTVGDGLLPNTRMEPIRVNPAEPVYGIFMVTLSAELPSKPSSPVVYSEK